MMAMMDVAHLPCWVCFVHIHDCLLLQLLQEVHKPAVQVKHAITLSKDPGCQTTPQFDDTCAATKQSEKQQSAMHYMHLLTEPEQVSLH